MRPSLVTRCGYRLKFEAYLGGVAPYRGCPYPLRRLLLCRGPWVHAKTREQRSDAERLTPDTAAIRPSGQGCVALRLNSPMPRRCRPGRGLCLRGRTLPLVSTDAGRSIIYRPWAQHQNSRTSPYDVLTARHYCAVNPNPCCTFRSIASFLCNTACYTNSCAYPRVSSSTFGKPKKSRWAHARTPRTRAVHTLSVCKHPTGPTPRC